MGYYLVDHPPRTQQFRCPRREKLSGIIGVHTAENIADEVGPDTGAENTAAFIARRTNYGSYHFLADSDSIIQLVDMDCVAYHIAPHGFNEHTIGISAAVQASRWNEVSDEWEDKCLRNMARAAAKAARHIKRRTSIVVPARRLTLSEALARKPGFLAHGTADPDRRTDPDGPNREFKWSRFLAYYTQEMQETTTTKPEGDAEVVTDADVERIAKRSASLVLNAVYTDMVRTGDAAERHVHNYLRLTDRNAHYAHHHAHAARQEIGKLAAQVAALGSAVQQLASGATVDMTAVQAAAREGAEQALATLDATITLDLEPEGTN